MMLVLDSHEVMLIECRVYEFPQFHFSLSSPIDACVELLITMSPSSFNPLILDPTSVAPAFASDGSPGTGQVPSLTSTNNFINFCLTYPRLPNTNGSDIPTGSCNSVQMGHIPSVKNMPSVKIVSPKHGDTVQAHRELRISLAVRNIEVAIPTGPKADFLSAPQQLDYLGVITGSAFMVIDEVSNFTDTRPVDPQMSWISADLGNPVVNDVSQIIIIDLPPGIFRIAAKLRSSNYQPVLVPTPEHGSLSDMIYITVGDGKGTGSGAKPGIVGNSTVSAAVNTHNSSQSSMMLDPKMVSGPVVTQTDELKPWLPSPSIFINDCNTPLTNGETILGGSCNPVPMGVVPAKTSIPSSKFTNPKNGDNIPAGEAFTISLAVRNFQTGSLANPQKSYLAAPQQVNAQGLIIGHAKVVIDALTGFNQTTPTDPTKFAFFEHIGSPAKGGILTASVSDGLPDGFYRMSSILCATNSQPVIVPFSEVGMSDDAVYFTVGDPTKPTTSDGGDKVSDDNKPLTSSGSSPSSRSADKAVIVGGATAGSVLGAIVVCAVVYAIIRFRRRRNVNLDAEAPLGFLTPFSFFQSIQNPYRRREKPTDPGPPSGLAPDASPPVVQQKATQIVETSEAASMGVCHSEIVPESSTGENPPPYEP